MAEPALLAQGVIALAFPGILIAAAVSDLVRYLIPNALPIALVGAFLLAAPLADMPAEVVLHHGLAGLAVLAAGFVLFMFDVLGGGDVKLLAAAAVWTGFGALGPFLLAVTLAGGVVALVLLIARRLIPRGRPGDGALARLMSPRQGVPYGVAIAVAGLAVMPRIAMTAPLMAWLGLAQAS